MKTTRALRTTVPVRAIGPMIQPWAGPGRIAAPGSLTSSARTGSLGVIKWPVSMGD